MDHAKIRELNDAFRKGRRPELGRIMITSGARELVNAWPLGETMLINQVRRFEPSRKTTIRGTSMTVGASSFSVKRCSESRLLG
jgi:hypothetical protein